MKIRWKTTISGTVHGVPQGVRPGDVMVVDDKFGAGYCAAHLAEPVVERLEERAVVSVDAEVRGGGAVEVSAPEPEAEPEAEPEPEKRGPGRPRKAV